MNDNICEKLLKIEEKFDSDKSINAIDIDIMDEEVIRTIL